MSSCFRNISMPSISIHSEIHKDKVCTCWQWLTTSVSFPPLLPPFHRNHFGSYGVPCKSCFTPFRRLEIEPTKTVIPGNEWSKINTKGNSVKDFLKIIFFVLLLYISSSGATLDYLELKWSILLYKFYQYFWNTDLFLIYENLYLLIYIFWYSLVLLCCPQI